ncbi:substrate-binding periplasmic protein [Lacibacterium aquatile]|uniref:Substrate-binding periplasmic protein n=1 Tax=Lacibacterium aquatile TaxID=1168082 RepID=A0ABW5DRZ7_9PROT
MAADDKRPVRIFGSDQTPPKYYLEDGKARGYAFDIALEALRRIGRQGSPEAIPWARALQNSRDGLGIIVGFSRTAQREVDYLYTNYPMFIDPVLLVYRSGDPQFANWFPTLPKQRVAVSRGARYCPTYNRDIAEASTVLETPDGAHRLNLLVRQRVDIAVFSGGKTTVETAAARAGIALQEITISPQPICLDPNYIGIGRSMPGGEALRDALDIALEEMERDGSIDKIKAPYLDDR